ncbi:hypothetical protein CBR_g22380 [Chara braunii]|uniref:TAFII55 protein conserved region domain-containing protein n=1 Tax=Chara braunii TaxID=69332 RepID=A0A388JV01_CHABU|nr:hypothetical protein CBR_g22380 [Chara braunii]|eukprot:GBG61583.1 hypothetical protein CBR_g22380 [Chara braunii]
MEEQFILRVPPSVAERIERALNEDPSGASDGPINLSFEEEGRNGYFVIGEDRFPVSLLDLPCVVESYKTYDDTNLVKTGDIGQMILVREPGLEPIEGPEHRHGVTPPFRDVRRRRFRRDPELNPALVSSVENDLMNILQGGTVRDVEMEVVEHEEEADDDKEEGEVGGVGGEEAADHDAQQGGLATGQSTRAGKQGVGVGGGGGGGGGVEAGLKQAAQGREGEKKSPLSDYSDDEDDEDDDDDLMDGYAE